MRTDLDLNQVQQAATAISSPVASMQSIINVLLQEIVQLRNERDEARQVVAVNGQAKVAGKSAHP